MLVTQKETHGRKERSATRRDKRCVYIMILIGAARSKCIYYGVKTEESGSPFGEIVNESLRGD